MDSQDVRMSSGVSSQKEMALGLTRGARERAMSATLAMNEAVARRRAEGRETIHLGFGEASFPLHPLLEGALGGAARSTGYAPVLGIGELRGAIAGYLGRSRQVGFSADEIVVGPGSKPLLYALMQVLEGDVLLPVPAWVSYAPQAWLAGKRAIGVQADAVDRHRLTPEMLAEALDYARREGANPRIVLVNTPSNPTGGMFDRGDVEALAVWARDAGMTLISDEIYAELAHGWREHVSPAQFYPEGCIVTGGLSKAFSAGGWRLGYAALPAGEGGRQLRGALRALASEVWSATATPVQEAAVVAFAPDSEIELYVRRSARVHGHAAGRLYETLVKLGVPCPRPAGGFYLYPDFAPWREALRARGIATSSELAHYLLDEWDVATLPGTAFGEQAEALRLRLATSMLYSRDGVGASSPGAEREAGLWALLEQADRLPGGDAASGHVLPMPELERAQARLTEFVEFLNSVVYSRV